MKTLSERLKHARAEKGWSQGHLAAAAGVAPSTIGNIEQGTRLSKGSIPQLAEALGVSYKWLANGEGDMNNENPPAKAANDPPIYSPLADSLANLFDKLPKDDPVLQSDVYAKASEVIRVALKRLPNAQTTQEPPDSPKTPSAKRQPTKVRNT